MATFFKYKERDDINKSMIDWSGLTKTISDNLINEKERRDKAKFELEEDQLTKLKAVEDFTQGTDPTMNQKMMEMAQNYKEYLVEQHYLMKNGLVSVNDTKLRKQGAMDTFNAINDVTKVYNEKMQTFIDKGGNVNEFMAENVARALNIANSTLIIDPKSGMGTFVTTDESGNEIAIPAKAFNNVLNDTYERFDTTAAISDAMKNAGTWVNSPNAFTSISDLRQNPEYNKWKKGRIDMMLANDKTVVSAAADTALGMRPTFDKELVKSNPDKFFLAKNEGGKITYDVEGLKEKVYNFLETELEIAIDREVKKSQPASPTRESDTSRFRKQEASELYEISSRIAQGDSAAFGNIKNRQFTIVNSDGTKKTAILGEPVKVGNSILFNDRDGNVVTTVELTGDNYQDAQNIAGVIRNDLTADKVQSLFKIGAQEFKGAIPSLIGETVPTMEQESIIENLPVNEDRALEFLKSNLDTDIFAIDVPFNPGADTIRIRHKKTDESTGEVSTSDIATIKDFLSKYNAVPMMITQPTPQPTPTTPEVDAFGNPIK